MLCVLHEWLWRWAEWKGKKMPRGPVLAQRNIKSSCWSQRWKICQDLRNGLLPPFIVGGLQATGTTLSWLPQWSPSRPNLTTHNLTTSPVGLKTQPCNNLPLLRSIQVPRGTWLLETQLYNLCNLGVSIKLLLSIHITHWGGSYSTKYGQNCEVWSKLTAGRICEIFWSGLEGYKFISMIQ